MSNNKKSSIDFLIEQILLKHPIITQFLPNWNFDKSIIEKAKSMHREEIKKAQVVAFSDGLDTSNRNYTPLYDSWEQYYNETFEENN